MTDASPDAYRRVSFWLDDLVARGLDDLRPRAALTASARFDVAPHRRRPHRALDGVRAVEGRPVAAHRGARARDRRVRRVGPQRRMVLGAVPAVGRRRSSASTGSSSAVAMRRAMVDTVDEVGRVTGARGHRLRLRERAARSCSPASDAQREAAEAEVAEARRFGVDRLEYWDERTIAATLRRDRRSTARAPDGGLRSRVRPRAPGEARARARPGRRSPRRRASSSAPRCSTGRPGGCASDALDGSGAEGTVSRTTRDRRDRGLRRPAAARASTHPPALLAHDRDRAARRRRLGRDRHRARPDLQRLPASAHLRPAHRRQPLRVRRPRRELPLGQRDRSGVRAGRPGVRAPARRAARPLPRRRRRPR